METRLLVHVYTGNSVQLVSVSMETKLGASTTQMAVMWTEHNESLVWNEKMMARKYIYLKLSG
jgi:hypothetical protein